MSTFPFTVRPEQPADAAAIEALHAEAFGPGRFARAAFRVRERISHAAELSFVADAQDDGGLVGSVRLTRIRIGSTPAVLLGPLTVAPRCKNAGIGRALMRQGLAAASEHGEDLVLLVGDLPYYAPFGFTRVPAMRVSLPGPVDPDRLLIAELREGASTGLAGTVTERPLSPETPGTGTAKRAVAEI